MAAISANEEIHGAKGFTLIELLVVITIISVLAALLMPALKNAKDSAKSVQCMGNLRSAVLGMTMYLNDHEQRFPGGQLTGSYDGQDLNVSGGPWKLLIPYIYDNNTANRITNGQLPKVFVWACPADQARTCFSAKGWPMAGVEAWPGSYGYNYSIAHEYLSNPAGNESGFGPANVYVNKARRAEELFDVVIFADTVYIPWLYADLNPATAFPSPANNKHGIDDTAYGYDYDAGPGPFLTGAATRHGGKVHFGFGDGHVAAAKKDVALKTRTNWPLF